MPERQASFIPLALYSQLNSSERNGFGFNVSHMDAEEFLPPAKINRTRLELKSELALK